MFSDIQRTVRVKDSIWKQFDKVVRANGFDSGDVLAGLLSAYVNNNAGIKTDNRRMDSLPVASLEESQRREELARQKYIERLKSRRSSA